MQLANIHLAKTQLSQLNSRALAGEEVIIARAGEPLVRLVPVHQDTTPRQGGQIWKAEDLDAPSPEIEQLFAGDGKP